MPNNKYIFGQASESNLIGVHPDLVKVVRRALELTPIDFKVIEGRRTLERQHELVKAGASQTLNSRHLTGHAVDIVPLPNGKVSWEWKYFYPMVDAMKQAAAELGIAVEWGGNWTTFKDGPHFQLPARQYPG
ncbi:M15 family metallopeptidase [Yersinia ruckeri]|uniref:M15 family metallopeptidase n=1 Tax=Yersinia ruckeri TaxID=29486 RepID=UPI0020BDA19E|nr:M15 family metallopeptidase [Yersinia ruckeri]MCK8542072.1 M15 family metallopeptidase [Yersinia ruckeri]MCK8553144.1 M15 family metallopeptidase [Yersinia ruckeri]MCW6519268.1 M15 family metallopeptidase [Yersinia ruckeri]MCW6553522.1 M15 family metallopeptidase [Yersinia ruckeri]MCW6579661.1 M15 family metallopeptidase [Yersinia ruckeri]